MPTYYPQEAGDAIMLALIVLAAIIGAGSWIAGLYDLRNPLPPTPEDDDFREVPNQREIAAQHCAKVHTKLDAADLVHGTSENLLFVTTYHGSNGMYWDDHAREWVVEP